MLLQTRPLETRRKTKAELCPKMIGMKPFCMFVVDLEVVENRINMAAIPRLCDYDISEKTGFNIENPDVSVLFIYSWFITKIQKGMEHYAASFIVRLFVVFLFSNWEAGIWFKNWSFCTRNNKIVLHEKQFAITFTQTRVMAAEDIIENYSR